MFFTRSHASFGVSTVLILLGVIAFGFTCTGMSSHASIHPAMDAMSVVSSSSRVECCNAAITKHFESLRNIPIIAPREMRDGLVLLGLALTLVFFAHHLRFKHTATNHHFLYYKFAARNIIESFFSNHLKLALARGILHQKLYI